jgi:hypothetical protein
MALTPEQVAACVDANAAAVGLVIAPGHRPGVLHYFALAASMAELVNGLQLPADAEGAAVFTPISPDSSPSERA